MIGVNIRRRSLFQGAAGVALLAVPGFGAAVAAEEAPRIMRWLLGYAPGGGTDTLLRMLAPRVGEKLGSSIVIENKSGANGNLASEAAAKSLPDGATWLCNTSSVITSPWLYEKIAFDPFRDFAPVCRIADVPLLLVVHPDVQARSLTEFIALARAQRGQLTYASAGNGNITHLANLLLQQSTDFTAVHVPYRGGGPALAAVAAGHVQFYMDTANTALGFVKAGRLRALACTAAQRLSVLPDVPTVAETVAPGFEAGSWSGLLAPARTPSALIARVATSVNDALNDPDLSASLVAQATQARWLAPQDYATFLRAEYTRWGQIVREHAIKLE
jgi:tripartite-type tricarboxylate transporter receptor subunit TctC